LRQREKCKSKKRGSKRIILNNICRVFSGYPEIKTCSVTVHLHLNRSAFPRSDTPAAAGHKSASAFEISLESVDKVRVHIERRCIVNLGGDRAEVELCRRLVRGSVELS